jgi:hypothetical protein
MKLHSIAVDGVPSPQVKRGVVELYQAVTEEVLSREGPPNGEDVTDDDRRTIGRKTRRVSSTKQGRKNAGMIFRAKLDRLATRDTAGSERDVWETWHYEPLGARHRGRCRTLMTSEKTTVLCL